MGAPQAQYAPQRQAMVVQSGDDMYCGPMTIAVGAVICFFTGCGCWVALCPMDRRSGTTTIVQ